MLLFRPEEFGYRRGAVGEGHHFHAGFAENAFQDLVVGPIVIDHEDFYSFQVFCRRAVRRLLRRLPHHRCEQEGGAFADRGFNPNFPVHQVGDSPADRQTEAGAAVFSGRRAIRLLKGLKNCRELVVRNADARIAYFGEQCDGFFILLVYFEA